MKIKKKEYKLIIAIQKSLIKVLLKDVKKLNKILDRIQKEQYSND